MQHQKKLETWLEKNANSNNYLFTLKGLRALFSELTDNAFKTMISRSVKNKVLIRVCRGIYLYKKADPQDGLTIYRTAKLLRSNCFNYLSLESILSDIGAISQIPINVISIMTSGRSAEINCGFFGKIIFVHTNQKLENLESNVIYDKNIKIWRATPKQALQDMKNTKRNLDLINWEVIGELI